ncbi:MAG: hypothetical protein KDK36_02140 [Leptospiraceae bacterium]|nr:hypothetical protein [Leptospiraceae bacterium]
MEIKGKEKKPGKNLLEAVKLLLMANSKAYDLIRGAENSELISPNSEKLAITLKYELGRPARIRGLQIRFKENLGDCLIVIKNNMTNDEIISGEVQLSQVGNRINADIVRDELPVNFVIQSGTNLHVYIKSKTHTINPGDINVTMFGKFLEEKK